ncbi:Peroxisomal acyl-coenzyme A oxidase 3, partial [Bos mutus]
MAPLRESSGDPVLPDPPQGPLHVARARASFPWKELALFWEGEDTLRFKKAIFSALENDPLFAHPRGSRLSVEKYQELNFLRCKRVFEYDFLPVGDMLDSLPRVLALIECLGMYDWSLAVKFFLHVLTFGSAIYSSGSERHLKYLPKIFSLEVSWRSWVTSDEDSSVRQSLTSVFSLVQEFIIHSPDFEAAKFWVGNMGKTATHAVVFAQLYTPGGQCHGLHPFLVQIRDPKTLLPMPGVMVGDIGKKLGQNGLDNGFAMFHKVRIPRQDPLCPSLRWPTVPGPLPSALLPQDVGQRFSESLGSLSSGRVAIVGTSVVNLKLAVSIALRFSATRRQFGPTDKEEVPVLQYPMQQWRLLPYLAAAYALDHFFKSLFLDLGELQQGLLGKDRSVRQAELGREIHALSSAGKPLASWTAQRGIQECREACGGHGYLAMNRLGDLRDDNDPNCWRCGGGGFVFQTRPGVGGPWLSLESPAVPLGGARIESPLKTVDFLDGYADILGRRFEGSSPEDLLDSS